MDHSLVDGELVSTIVKMWILQTKTPQTKLESEATLV